MATILSTHSTLFRPSFNLIATLHGSGWMSQSPVATAYVYHPRKQTLEADIQAFLWTKTQSVKHPPRTVLEIRERLKLDPFLSLIDHVILASRVYETQEVKMKYKNKPKDLTRGAHKNFPFSLMQNILKFVLNHSAQYPQLRNLGVSLEPFVSATWPCMGDKISVRGKQDMVLNSKAPLPQFYDPLLTEQSMDYSFESLGQASPFIDLKKYPVTEQISSGFTETRTLFPHFHTLFVIDNGEYIEPPSKGLPEIQLLQNGIVFTFGRLFAQAVSKYGRDVIGRDLPEPECAQCIVTDGCRFSFLWYQLNTLNTNNTNEGVKNLVCIDRPGLLYSSVEADGLFKKTIVDLNEDILRSLISMYLLK